MWKCGQDFRQQTELNIHLRQKHPKVPGDRSGFFKCPNCTKEFHTYSGRCKHVQNCKNWYHHERLCLVYVYCRKSCRVYFTIHTLGILSTYGVPWASAVKNSPVMGWGALSKQSNIKMSRERPIHQPTHKTIDPPIGGGVFTYFKSSDRIEISWFI